MTVMSQMPLTRPLATLSPPTLLAGLEHFQCAYVTNDLDRACDVLSRQFGLGRFDFIEGDLADGGTIRVAFAWAGGTMYEIIDADGAAASFYTKRLPDDFAIRFHHLGFLLPDVEAWEAMRRTFAEQGRPVVFETLNPGFMDAIYVEAPELGHYLEYILPAEQGMAFFGAVPAS